MSTHSRLKQLIEARRQNRSWEGQLRDTHGRWAKEDVAAAASNYGRHLTIRENLHTNQAEALLRQKKKEQILQALKNYGRRLSIREELRQEPIKFQPSPILKTPEEYINKGREFLKQYPELHEYKEKTQEYERLSNQTAPLRSTAASRQEKATRIFQLHDDIEALNKKLPAIAKSIGDKFISTSPLSASQAVQLVEPINVYDSLGDNPRDIAQTKSEVAYFHQLIGSNLANLKEIKIDLIERPHASFNDGLIVHNLAYGDDTIPHEMSHFVEYEHPEIAVANNLWLKQRAIGSPEKINDLIGRKIVRDDEMAYPDKFFHPYVGKVYSPRINVGNNLIPATEVLSMGMDRIVPAMMGYDKRHHIQAFKDILMEDPEHLEFTLGAIAYLQEKNKLHTSSLILGDLD